MLYKQLWMKSLWDLSIEEQQAVEEGKDLSTIKAELGLAEKPETR